MITCQVKTSLKMFVTLFLVTLLMFLGFVYKYLTQYQGVVEGFGLPYIPRYGALGSPPFIFHQFNYHQWMLDQCNKFGKTWARYDGFRPTIVTTDPEFIKQVTVKQFDCFMDSFGLDVDIPEAQMLLLARGETWRALRKLLSPTFSTGKMKEMLEPICSMSERTIDHLIEKINPSSSKVTSVDKLDMKPIVHGFVLDIISKCAFGMDTTAYKGEEDSFTKLVKSVLGSFVANNWIGTLFFNCVSHFPVLASYIPIWSESALKLQKLTHDLIDERIKNNVEQGDFIDRLKQFKSAKLEPPLTLDLMDVQGMIFFTAGYETTATTIGHMIYLLAKNPTVQDQVYDEIINACETWDQINHDTIKNMPLLEASIMETLRLLPPVGEHMRICTKNCQVAGIDIPKGTKIQMPILPGHLNYAFFPFPTLFKPERFLKQNANQIAPFTWRPFGSGNRVCIGQRFAVTAIMIFMAKFLTKFQIIDIPDTKLNYPNGDLFLFVFPKMEVKLEPRPKK